MTPGLPAIEARAAAAREAVRPRRKCGECGTIDPVVVIVGGREFHDACPRMPPDSPYPVGVSQSLLSIDDTRALIADVTTLLAHIAALRAQHAAEVAAAVAGERERMAAVCNRVLASFGRERDAFDAGTVDHLGARQRHYGAMVLATALHNEGICADDPAPGVMAMGALYGHPAPTVEGSTYTADALTAPAATTGGAA